MTRQMYTQSTSLVARLAFQFPDLLLLVQMVSQCSHTNGIIYKGHPTHLLTHTDTHMHTYTQHVMCDTHSII